MCAPSHRTQIPADIPKTDYYLTGYPASEMESRQQHAGARAGCRARGAAALRSGGLPWTVLPPRLPSFCCPCTLHPAPVPWPPPTVKLRTEKDVKGIREACRIGRLVLDAAAAAVAPGVTTDEIDRIVRAGAGKGTA